MQPNFGISPIDPDFLSILKEKYNILNFFVLKYYDKDTDLLRQHLLSLKKDVFQPNDRIIVLQFDSDYYIDQRVGINLINLFTVWKEVDIPLSVMIYYTNNFGVSKEIDHICRYSHNKDRPAVIETFYNPGNYNIESSTNIIDLNVDSIQYHAISMMGRNRSHRFALYNHIKHLGDRVALSIQGLEK